MTFRELVFGPGSDALVVQTTAPAKLNLVLAVGAKRSDGYHELASVMQAIDLADQLTIRVSAGAGGHLAHPTVTKVTVDAPALPAGDTLATAAVEAFCERWGRALDVAVTIDKRIPIGAGFGGGSSDAAAVLRSLQVLTGSPLSPGELQATAADIGSDVTFFLTASGRALVRGRGDRVRELAPGADQIWVIATPASSVQTRTVFGRLASDRAADLPDDASLEAQAHALSVAPRNDLAAAAMEECSCSAALLSAFAALGVPAQVAGSGSGVWAAASSLVEATELLAAANEAGAAWGAVAQSCQIPQASG